MTRPSIIIDLFPLNYLWLIHDQRSNFLAISQPFWPLWGPIRVPSRILGPHIKISGLQPLLLITAITPLQAANTL